MDVKAGELTVFFIHDIFFLYFSFLTLFNVNKAEGSWKFERTSTLTEWEPTNRLERLIP